ncbi:MAG: hypothetical protein AB8F94_16580 [Saprospiraceae bacterium]
MLISFGGASAIGKTTLCQTFSNTHLIIPEANILFENEKREGEFWYYQKQVERFQLANLSKKDAIFDGDIFQPIWYNWIYGYPAQFSSKEVTHQFYLEKIMENEISFPDLYIIFFTNLENLKSRKENDLTRQRRNFEKHLRLIHPHKKYFNFLKNETDIPVEFVEYKDLETTQETVLALMNRFQSTDLDSVTNFKKIVNWLENSTPF